MDSTIEYYNKNARTYAQVTCGINMQEIYDHFEKHLLPQSHILDIGCGSGRDAKYYRSKDYLVTGIDPSIELCRIASEYAGISVINACIEEVIIKDKFDAIWACASLLHIKKRNMPLVLGKIHTFLRPKGILYASWKKGTGERKQNGRYFCDYTFEEINELLADFSEFQIVEEWESVQENNDGKTKWINIILRKR